MPSLIIQCRFVMLIVHPTLNFTMASIRSNVIYIFVAVFLLPLYEEQAHMVEGVTIEAVNIGDSITFSCNTHPFPINYNSWYRNGTILANKDGIRDDDPRITQEYSPGQYLDIDGTYTIHIANAKIVDSGFYKCTDFHQIELQSYDIHVIGCSCSVRDLEREKVVCDLDNYWANDLLQTNITINEDIYTGVIDENNLSFSIAGDLLYNNLQFDFNPYPRSDSDISCVITTEILPPQDSVSYPGRPTTLIQTTYSNQSTSKHDSTAPTSISTASQRIPISTTSSAGNNKTNATIVLGVLGSLCLLIFIVTVILCTLRYQGMRNRGQDPTNAPNILDEYQTTSDNYKTISIEGTSSSRGPRSAISKKIFEENRENQNDSNTLSNGGSFDSIPHDYMYLSCPTTKVDQTENHIYPMTEYANSMVRNQLKWKGVCSRPDDQYEDVLVPGKGDGITENNIYCDIE